MENDKIMGKKPHPGKDRTSGYFGFAEHDDLVSYRNHPYQAAVTV